MSLPSPIRYHVAGNEFGVEPSPYDYVMDYWGIIKRASTPHFLAHLRIATGRVAGLPQLSEGVVLRVPKVPAIWLHRMLDHALAAGDAGAVARPIETMYHLHWLDDQWRVAVPKQTASASRVSYRGGDASSVVAEIHSHHRMHAYFSPVDDADEQGCRIYGVIGRIFDRPEIRLRLGIYGDFVELDPLDVFEGLGPFRRAE